MRITPSVERWLQRAGYEYCCFISWAHAKKDPRMAECAREVKMHIESDLASVIHDPKVFLDQDSIRGGAEWERIVGQALCRSVAMVAICAPIYFHPAHRWCGLEWAAMDRLGRLRLAGEDFGAIIPVIYREARPLPRAIVPIQYIDISSVSVRGRRYYSMQDFLRKIRGVCETIEQIALALARRGIRAGCEEFEFPTEPAFLDYEARSQPFPFRS